MMGQDIVHANEAWFCYNVITLMLARALAHVIAPRPLQAVSRYDGIALTGRVARGGARRQALRQDAAKSERR